MMTQTARPGLLSLIRLPAIPRLRRAAPDAAPRDCQAEARAHRDLVVEMIHRDPDCFASEMDIGFLLDHSGR